MVDVQRHFGVVVTLGLVEVTILILVGWTVVTVARPLCSKCWLNVAFGCLISYRNSGIIGTVTRSCVLYIRAKRKRNPKRKLNVREYRRY